MLNPDCNSPGLVADDTTEFHRVEQRHARLTVELATATDDQRIAACQAMWTALATTFDALPDKFLTDDFAQHVLDTKIGFAQRLLTPDQFARLDWVAFYLDHVEIRPGTAAQQ